MDDVLRLFREATGARYDGDLHGFNDPNDTDDGSIDAGDVDFRSSMNDDHPDGPDDESDLENVVADDEEAESDEDSSGTEANVGDYGATEWSQNLSNVNIEQFIEDNVGPTHSIGFDGTPLVYFSLFFPTELFAELALQTNLYAEQRQAKAKQRDKHWRPATEADMRLFIAINITMGIIRLPAYHLYWSSDPFLRVPAVADLMGRTRYEKLSQYFHVSDSSTYIPRGREGHDPVHKVRPLLDQIETSCMENFKPWAPLSIDEAMIAFNGRLSFKQYIKGKPSPWGIKVWCLSCPISGYLVRFNVYTGKVSEPMPYGSGYHVVTKLGEPFLDRNHHFFFDRFFSSVKLSRDLLARKTYSCCTIMPNRKGWPTDMKPQALKRRKMKAGDVISRQDGNLLATAWRDKRQITLLSTNCNPQTVTVLRNAPGGRKEVNIPEVMDVYNRFMGGVDRHDQLQSYYPVGRSSKKWWRYLCWFLIQTAITNAFILFKLSHQPKPQGSEKQAHMNFRVQLCKELIRNNVPNRKRKAPLQPATVCPAQGREVHPGSHLTGPTCYYCKSVKKRNPTNRTPETVWGCVLCAVHLCKGFCFAKFHENLRK